MSQLLNLFRLLTAPARDSVEGARFSAVPIPEQPSHRVAVDPDGFPALLISATVGDERQAPIVLEHLIMQQGLDCRISEPDGSTHVEQFTLIRCTTRDPLLIDYFLRIGGSVIELLGPTPTHSDVGSVINKLVDLFRAMQSPPRKSLQGLWGELFVISRGTDARTLVQSWHVNPADRFDFSMAQQRLEVKAAAGRTRTHHFNLDQLVQVSGVDVLIASLFVETAGGGTSLGDLAEAARARVHDDPELSLRIDQVLGLTLGQQLTAALGQRFDIELAEDSLRFYAATSIPSPSRPLPPEVSEVRFRSDISSIGPVDAARYRDQGNLFAAALRY